MIDRPCTKAGRPLEVHRRLLRHFGPLSWWPAETPFEVMVGAVLTQNTAWRRVVPAIENLRHAGLLHPEALHGTPEERIAELIRPAGTFRVKAGFLRAIVDWLAGSYRGDVSEALAGDTMEKRSELLALRGVGRETADSILLYAGNHPIFVVDAYTRRVFSRHGLIEASADYDEIRLWFEARLPVEPAVLNELHAEIVILGKDFCRPRRPRCGACPLDSLFSELSVSRPPDAQVGA